MDHKVVGDRLTVVLHLGAENALAHKVGGAHHKQGHDHAHNGPDGAVWWRRRLLGRVCERERRGHLRNTSQRTVRSTVEPAPGRLTAADLVRVVGAVHVVVALLVLPDALAVGTGELVWGTTHLDRKGPCSFPV